MIALLLALPLSITPQIAVSQTLTEVEIPPTGPLKGWDYLVDALVKAGLDRELVESQFKDQRMPERGFIPFAVAPRESYDLYKKMLAKHRIAEARLCYQTNKTVVDRIAKSKGIPAAVIVSIMYVETGCGKFLGSTLVLPRLARLVGLAAPDNVAWNYRRLMKEDERVTHEQLKKRAAYLQETFLEQIHALISMCEHAQMSPYEFKGSSAGAFGIPQFLPLSLVKYGTDGDGDHRINLETIPDAAASIATYLAKNGWRAKMTRKDKMAVLFTYNRSEPYGDTVLKIAERIG